MNILSMMKQAKGLQDKMAELQASLETLSVEGVAGGGLVTVHLTGKSVMSRIEIDNSLLRSEDREILEDLIMAAHNDAKQKAESAVAAKMKELTGGLDLPAGFNPF